MTTTSIPALTPTTTPTNNHIQSNTNPVSGGGGGGHIQQRRGSLQLWQFLIALLDEPSSKFVIIFGIKKKVCDINSSSCIFSSCISWTGRGMEFKLIEPEEGINFNNN